MENYGKTKDKEMVYKINLGFENRLCVEKVLAPRNAYPKTISLIKWANYVWFIKIFIYFEKKEWKCK